MAIFHEFFSSLLNVDRRGDSSHFKDNWLCPTTQEFFSFLSTNVDREHKWPETPHCKRFCYTSILHWSNSFWKISQVELPYSFQHIFWSLDKINYVFKWIIWKWFSSKLDIIFEIFINILYEWSYVWMVLKRCDIKFDNN